MSCNPHPDVFLSPNLAVRGFSLRPQTDADLDFTVGLYVASRWEEIHGNSGWPEEVCLAFLQDQGRLQWRQYSLHYHDAQFLILERNGQLIGRLYLFHADPGDLRIIDIALTPASQGQGIGTALLSRVQDFAAAQNKSCSLHVVPMNPAHRLYTRLGFRDTEHAGLHIRMDWSPPVLGAKPEA